MITVLRRWFVPSEKLEEFRQRWQDQVLSDIIAQPGCVRVEVYESSIRDHWVSAVSWESEQRRQEALQALSRHHHYFAPYERFEPEILMLRSWISK